MSASSPSHRRLLLLLFKPIALQHNLRFLAIMPYSHRGKQWKQKASPSRPFPSALPSSSKAGVADVAAESVGRVRIAEAPLGGQQAWRPKAYTTAAGPTEAAAAVVTPEKEAPSLSKAFKGPLGAEFIVDNNTFTQAQIRATFYPKFENEKSHHEVRTRMIEMVSHGQATLEVSLKHSGSLFMYAGHKGGAYAKNSFGNIYTAVGVFVLGRMFNEAWGTQARRKQSEFNDFLEENRICISMELVTAVLGDHGQRPIDDYVVVTAVTELGNGKPKFYSTPDLIAFCRKWRLPTNHVWLFSTRKSVTSFFTSFDALCEEGTATPVCKALDEIADISVPGSKDHIKVQGEILEGLVARIVSHDSLKHMEKALRDFSPPSDGYWKGELRERDNQAESSGNHSENMPCKLSMDTHALRLWHPLVVHRVLQALHSRIFLEVHILISPWGLT